jgi:hypothetical protein
VSQLPSFSEFDSCSEDKNCVVNCGEVVGRLCNKGWVLVEPSVFFWFFSVHRHGSVAREMLKTWVSPQSEGGYPSLMLK